ncbi:hypothetical protein BZG36_04076 [Bifiguratus adelaidae]|uniref:Uncharacterized protein n=1 Tax=Bifiguratus adelaidae TaxID=1938954 RepID=A0A261XXS7_9FUNG|nr:hypothetical protein BZG36_04076 [Bifiguratus adelaidae]
MTTEPLDQSDAATSTLTPSKSPLHVISTPVTDHPLTQSHTSEPVEYPFPKPELYIDRVYSAPHQPHTTLDIPEAEEAASIHSNESYSGDEVYQSDEEHVQAPTRPNYWRGEYNAWRGTFQKWAGQAMGNQVLMSKADLLIHQGRQEVEAAKEEEEMRVDRRENN